jgi:hypothetical protein
LCAGRKERPEWCDEIIKSSSGFRNPTKGNFLKYRKSIHRQNVIISITIHYNIEKYLWHAFHSMERCYNIE